MRNLGRVALAGVVAVSSALAVSPAFASQPTPTASTSSVITFNFNAYVNNVRVIRPLVGQWQLGVAKVRGSGTFANGSLSGTIAADTDPKLARYPSALLRASVIGYSFVAGPHNSYRKLVLTVQVTRADNGGAACNPGVRGTVTIFDSAAKLSNGQSSDYVTMDHWTASRCPTFVQGWTNNNGGPRTSPQFGGPNGGQWARVAIAR